MLDVSLDLLPEPGAAGIARRWAGEVLASRADDGTRDQVELVLTELVQNAVFHANTPMRARLRDVDGRVQVAVSDGSTVLPSSGLTDAAAMSGRGLLMVAAVSSGWGAEPTRHGKTVWALLADPRATDAEGDDVSIDDLLDRWTDEDPTPLQLSDPAPLVVHGLPAATMLAVKTHNDDVFRELTLVAMGAHHDHEGEPHPAGDELVDVARRAREVLASFADGRQQVRNQVLSAVHEGLDTFDLTLSVGERALGVLGDYLDVLEQADRWAAEGLLLTEPPEPEVLAVRRRYLGALLDQLADG